MDNHIEDIKNRLQRIQQLLDEIRICLGSERYPTDSSDDLRHLPPITNGTAADLLCISTRQLQRVRYSYGLTWHARGRETLYEVAPIIRAIKRLNLRWDSHVLERLIASYRRLPDI